MKNWIELLGWQISLISFLSFLFAAWVKWLKRKSKEEECIRLKEENKELKTQIQDLINQISRRD